MRCVDSAPKLSRTSYTLLERLDVERPLDNAAQRARRIDAEVSETLVSNFACPPRSVPTIDLVSARLAYGYKLSICFHIISITRRFSKPSRGRVLYKAGHTNIDSEARLGVDDFVECSDFGVFRVHP